MFAFPLQVGAARLGAMDLYQQETGSLPSRTITKALGFADLHGPFLALLLAVPVLMGLCVALLKKQKNTNLAAKNINDQGGLNGGNVVTQTGDDNCVTAAQSVGAVQTVRHRDGLSLAPGHNWLR